MNILFGNTKTTETLPDGISTVTEDVDYRDGIENPKRKCYEIRKIVRSQKEEHELYLEFSQEISNDRTMLDPAFRIERTRPGDRDGYYYAVKCFTKLAR